MPDLMSEYGVDVHDDRLLRSRPWCWLRDLIFGLLSADTRLARHFAPPSDDHVDISLDR